MIRNYLKVALKVLGRRKFFTFISLFGITLTLVVLMVAAAMLDNAFAPQQPESRFDRVLGTYMVGIYGDHGGTTIIMVTHDDRFARRTDRIVRLFDGRQVA